MIYGLLTGVGRERVEPGFMQRTTRELREFGAWNLISSLDYGTDR